MQVHELLIKVAEIYPEKEAVWDKGKWSTYSEINSASKKIAKNLVNNGIKRGDRIAILHENSIDYITIYFGILFAGGVVVGLNTDTNSASVCYLLNNSEAKAVFVSKKGLKHLLPALDDCPA